MPILAANRIKKAFGAETVLTDVTFQLQPGERVGLVGPNGAGKTTLLRILTGQEGPDGGVFTLARGTTMGYLVQSAHVEVEGTMEQELRRAFSKLERMAVELKLFEEKLAAAEKNACSLPGLLDSYGSLRHAYEEAGGYHTESRLRSVAVGLGFDLHDMSREVFGFSGGERTRLRLARLLLEQPDLLLLDEPTNHLDTASVEWLEGFLREWRGSALIVSHDRYFLDRVANRILALDEGEIKSYPGNYSAYNVQKELETVSLQKAYKKQQAIIEKEADLIRTAGTGEREKRQAKSREKRLAKVGITQKPRSEDSIGLDFGYCGRSGEIVASLENVSKSFDKTTLFEGVNAELRFGDRVALVGPNGAGKTTLLRIIAKEILPDKGYVRLGLSVRITYFDQHQGALTQEKTPLEEIMDASQMTLTEARSYLGRFLFSGDDVFKRNEDLSGGERSRLALAKLGLDAGNFLILDEPTNHLDIRSVEELENSILEFPGTLLVVSHDRYFIGRIASKILDVSGGQVTLYKMSYDDYLLERERRSFAHSHLPDREKKRVQAEKERLERGKMLSLRRERRNLERQLQETEEQITVAESSVNSLEEELADPLVFNNFILARDKAGQLQDIKRKLDDLYVKWEKLCSELEEMQEVD
ncbi:MAG: ABC-F family ATP-binding cassette domain-containing protein [Dethiobacter sp.]|jgi:ATP-binding cassette subfamily F protein 3|nr:ABC-F family ATP-binding cassette domain-containing protein [Dethiobacter sp.]